MPRRNPGPFEPIRYIIQTPGFFRVFGIGGLVLLTIVALVRAAAHGAGSVLLGLVLLGGLWAESTFTVCRRCRHFGTWHCAGQGMITARLVGKAAPGISEARATLHFVLVGLYLAYGLFWAWHGIATGVIFTIWAPLFLLSAIPAGGFSWRTARQPSQAA